jgi:GntR family transcriptional regulator
MCANADRMGIVANGDDAHGNSAPVVAGAGVPLHRQLFLVLHDEIARGALAPGDPLPTEQVLCEQFRVSRVTVRRALASLAEQGYIERRQGVGTFVRQYNPSISATGSGSYMDGLRQAQFQTAAEVVEFDCRVPPRTVARHVPFAGDALHILRRRRERRTAEPLIVTEVWLPIEFADILNEKSLVRTPLYAVFADAGVTIDRVEHAITAEIAGPRMAWLLDIAIGSPVLRVDRIAYTAESAHHFLTSFLSPSRSRILFSLLVDDLESADRIVIAHDVRRPPQI